MDCCPQLEANLRTRVVRGQYRVEKAYRVKVDEEMPSEADLARQLSVPPEDEPSCVLFYRTRLGV